ncbi:MAG: thioesterase domain-containing protein [Pseudomonadota bacterium]
MDTILQELQTILHRQIPITQSMGITVDGHVGDALILRAPLRDNLNQKATAFAGSLNAVATLAGWGMLFVLLREMGVSAQVVIQESTIAYRRPVTRDFEAACRRPEARELEQFKKTLLKRGKARLALHAEIAVDGEPAVVFHGRYVAELEGTA